MGSAAVYHLARRGQRVLGLERFDVPHDMGSSHGHTRIIRLAYYEHPSYVMLLRRAYELWREIEQRSGEQLLHITGSIDAGPADSWVFKGSLQSCLEHDLPHEVLTGIELTERFPGYRLPHETLAVLQPDGGFLVPERCIVAYVKAARRWAPRSTAASAVLDWEPLGDEGVRVHHRPRRVRGRPAGDHRRRLERRHARLPARAGCAGAPGAGLASAAPAGAASTPRRFPVFNLLVEEGRYYGFPVHAVPGFKFGRYHHFEETGIPTRSTASRIPTTSRCCASSPRATSPMAAGPTMTLKSCMFTNTPDHHFIIDLHPRYPQVSFASPCSGHGFKFASVIGEIMADLAERGKRATTSICSGSTASLIRTIA